MLPLNKHRSSRRAEIYKRHGILLREYDMNQKVVQWAHVQYNIEQQ